jgi:hypothetical protein
MRFQSEKALHQFIKKGVVATLDDYPFEEGQTVTVNNRARAKIERVLPYLDISTLERYTEISGFSSAQEWLSETMRLLNKLPNFVIMVKKRD